MTKFAVAAMNFFDNELTIEIIEADNWCDALVQHTQYKLDKSEDEPFDWPKDMEDAKAEAFNMDSMFDVVELE